MKKYKIQIYFYNEVWQTNKILQSFLFDSMPILCNVERDIDSDCEQKVFIKFNELLIELHKNI